MSDDGARHLNHNRSEDNLLIDQHEHSSAAATGEATQYTPLEAIWDKSIKEIFAINPRTENWKIQTLPLARIKKIMKSEEFIIMQMERERTPHDGSVAAFTKFMISSDAPLVMSKACEIFIRDVCTRAWQHTEQNRRRTLQRQDVCAAVGDSEVFDFLIDIVPRPSSSSATHSSLNLHHEAIPASVYAHPDMTHMTVPLYGNPNVQYTSQATHATATTSSQLSEVDFEPIQGEQLPFYHHLSMSGMEETDSISALGSGLMTYVGHPNQSSPYPDLPNPTQPPNLPGQQLLPHQQQEQGQQSPHPQAQQRQQTFPPQWSNSTV